MARWRRCSASCSSSGASASGDPEAGPAVVRREELPYPAVFEDAAVPVRDVAVTGVASYSARARAQAWRSLIRV